MSSAWRRTGKRHRKEAGRRRAPKSLTIPGAAQIPPCWNATLRAAERPPKCADLPRSHFRAHAAALRSGFAASWE